MANTFIDDILKKMNAGQFNPGAPSIPFTGPTAASTPQVGPTVANAAQPPQIAPQLDVLGAQPLNPNVTAPIQNIGTPAVGPQVATVQPSERFISQSDKEASEFFGSLPGADTAFGEENLTTPPPNIGRPSTPESIANLSIGDKPLTPRSIMGDAPSVPVDGLTTTGDQPLSEFLSGGQQLDPQGRMIDPNVDRSFFEQQSAERNERALAEFGQARGPDSTDRAEGELSMADAVALAEGDRDKARALVVASRQPKVDERTPEQVVSDEAKAEGVRLENERKQQIIDQGNQPNATGFQKKQGEWEERKKDLEAEGMSEKEIAARRRAFLHGDTFDPFEFEDIGGDADSTGGSTSDAGSTPAASTPTVNTQAEYDALPSGAQYIDSKGNQATKK